MARYQVILTYDGSQYQGFQRQASPDTIQGMVETALCGLGWEGQSILYAGRTDTGVHAYGQVIAFDLDWKHSDGELQAAMNSLLPDSIAVRSVHQAADSFHPRYDASMRSYRYQIFCRPERSPLRERFAWRVWPAVDLGKLSLAAEQILGRHDFAAFGSSPRTGGSTQRTVFLASWKAIENHWNTPDLVFEISADAFLYHMVRRLVYIQVAIGQDRLVADVIRRNLDDPPAEVLQGLAPPQGLFLMSVSYEGRNRAST